MKKKICVIGANGFVGGALCNEIDNNARYEPVRVTRSDNIRMSIEQADIVIHAANSSKRYYANNNPEEDFRDTVEKMAKILSMVADRKFILISTVSAKTQLDTPYGRHRRACELMVDQTKNLIFRLSAMYGKQNKKGALFDIIQNNKVFVCKHTKYALVDVEYNAKKILEFIGECGMRELGAKNYIELGHIAEAIGSTSIFGERDDSQIPVAPPLDAPDAHEAIEFAKREKNEWE